MNENVPAPEAMPQAKIHLSDVEFRQDTLYFVVLDRFCDGCRPSQGENSALNDFTRQDWNKYWGGNLQGLLDRLDYLQSMGITAIWVTPLFQQIESLAGERAPIHGYWTSDFKRINERWVNDPSEVRIFTRDDTVFDRLLQEMHRRGMKFVLDIVCNHSSPASENGKGQLYDDGELVADFENDTGHWYHHYGEVQDWQDEWQIQNCEAGGLAKFNENNVHYRRYIKGALKLWLAKGVDALRIDTVKHMPIWFWQELNADLLTQKPDVFIFGEWIFNHPLNEASVNFANKADMSLLDFAFCIAIRQCLGEGQEAGFKLVQEVLDHDSNYRGAGELVTFFENHDMPRLQTLNPEEGILHLALVLLLTSRGIPCLYYGCEQYLHNDTDGGNDPYNRPMMERWEDTEARRLITVLNKERASNPALQWGGHWAKHVEADLYAYLRSYRDSRCLVILNRGEERDFASENLGLEDGTYSCLLSGREVRIEGSRLALALKRHESLVLSKRGKPIRGKSLVRLQVNGAPTQPGDTLALIGDAPELGEWDLAKAVSLEGINNNTWFGEVPFEASAGFPVAYKFVIFRKEGGAPCREVRTCRRRSIAEGQPAKWRDIWEQ
jgi:cyclomaltodextrin glucanotransferase